MVKPTEYINLNGKLVPWHEAKIHVLTHALHYGSGVFEGTRIYYNENDEQTYIFRLDDHLRRLYNGIKVYRMDEEIEVTLEDMRTQSVELVRENDIKEKGYIRHIVYRGAMYEVPERGKSGSFGLNPFNSPVDYAIVAFALGAYLGEDALRRGAHVTVSSWRRINHQSTPPFVKASGNYVNSMLAKMNAVLLNFNEAILLDYQGYVSEGSGENIFWVKDGKVYTPPLSASILPGITRDTVMQLASDLGYDVFEQNTTVAQLLTSDEVFFTGTAGEVTPITRIDHIKIADGTVGPITKKLQEKFFEIVQGNDPKYNKWLTPVF